MIPRELSDESRAALRPYMASIHQDEENFIQNNDNTQLVPGFHQYENESPTAGDIKSFWVNSETGLG